MPLPLCWTPSRALRSAHGTNRPIDCALLTSARGWLLPRATAFAIVVWASGSGHLRAAQKGRKQPL